MEIISQELIDCLQLLQDVESQFQKKDDAIRSVEAKTSGAHVVLLTAECGKAPLKDCGLLQPLTDFYSLLMYGMDFDSQLPHTTRNSY